MPHGMPHMGNRSDIRGSEIASPLPGRVNAPIHHATAPSPMGVRPIPYSISSSMGPTNDPMAGAPDARSSLNPDIIARLLEVLRRQRGGASPADPSATADPFAMAGAPDPRSIRADLSQMFGAPGIGPTPGPDRSPMYHGQPRRPRRMDMGRFRG
jgi:hypothetical protein